MPGIVKLVGSAIDAPRRSLRDKRSGLVAGSVREALEAESPAAVDIEVREAHGVVTLRGEVDDIHDIARYDSVARAVPGVVDVDNLLRLRLAGTVRPRVLTA